MKEKLKSLPILKKGRKYGYIEEIVRTKDLNQIIYWPQKY